MVADRALHVSGLPVDAFVAASSSSLPGEASSYSNNEETATHGQLFQSTWGTGYFAGGSKDSAAGSSGGGGVRRQGSRSGSLRSSKSNSGVGSSSSSTTNGDGCFLVYDFHSIVRGSFTVSLEEDTGGFKYLKQLAENFWNVRVPLKKLGGAFDVSSTLAGDLS